MEKISIRAIGLNKWFGTADAKTFAVKDVSFEAKAGEILYVVGPSGSGKTTLLSMISGVLQPDSGQVWAQDCDLWKLSANDLADFRLNKIGFVFQDFHLFPRLTTAENVAIPLILKKMKWEDAIKIAKENLDIVGLASKADIPPLKLSGGEQQRVAIARAIVSQPDLLVLDEPTASLDGDTGRKIMQFIKDHILNQNRCIITVTHDSRIFEFADAILKMEDGKVLGIEKVVYEK